MDTDRSGTGPDGHHTNAVDGAWVTWDTRLNVEDRRRIFTYQHGTYSAFHTGA